MEKISELVAPCGRYCGDCGVCGDVISMKMNALKEVFDATGIMKSADTIGWPLMKEIASKACSDFETSMKSFDGWTMKCFPRNCRRGCVPPHICKIPQCSSSKKYVTCAECDEYDKCTMPNIRKFEEAVKCLEDIRSNGIDVVAEKKYNEMISKLKCELAAAINRTG